MLHIIPSFPAIRCDRVRQINVFTADSHLRRGPGCTAHICSQDEMIVPHVLFEYSEQFSVWSVKAPRKVPDRETSESLSRNRISAGFSPSERLLPAGEGGRQNPRGDAGAESSSRWGGCGGRLCPRSQDVTSNTDNLNLDRFHLQIK